MEPEVSKFCLKWNSHHLVLVDALLERERLVDITLVKEDQFICGHHHHVLLSCSQYFAVGCLFCNLKKKNFTYFLIFFKIVHAQK